MSRISSPNKDAYYQFFFDKQTTPAIKVYPTPENSTDILVFNKLVRMDDLDTATNTMDLPFKAIYEEAELKEEL